MKVSQIAKATGYSSEELLLQIKAAGLSQKMLMKKLITKTKTLLNFIKSSKKSFKKNISLKKLQIKLVQTLRSQLPG